MAFRIDNDGNVTVSGRLTPEKLTYPPESIRGEDFSGDPGDRLPAGKAIHQFPVSYRQADGSDVVAETMLVHTAHGSAEIVDVEVVTATAPTGGDLAFTVDVQSGNQATTFSSVMSSVVTIDSTVADREVVVGTVSTSSVADGDTLQVVISTTGSTGSQGQGLVVNVWLREEPQ